MIFELFSLHRVGKPQTLTEHNMKTTIYTLLLTGVAILPLKANAQSMTAQTTVAQTQINQNLTQPELNAIRDGQLTNNGQPIPVDTKIMMSTGNLDGYTVGRIQQSLADRGYYKGAITGRWDDNTAAATRAFQQASGDKIDESGVLISSGTLARLGVPLDKLTAGDGARVNGTLPPHATNTTTATHLRQSMNTGISYNPYTSSTVRTLGTVQRSANGDTPAGTYVGNSKISSPGQTVAAPDNGSKSTLTRNAVASGRFNQTVDGSVARGTTDGTAIQSSSTSNNAIAGTRATTRINSNNIANAPVAGSASLTAGGTSSAQINSTGSLTDSSAPPVISGNRFGNALEPDDSTTALSNARISPASGNSTAATTGTLSNSTSPSATGSSTGIANSGGSLSGDGRSANTSSLSGNTGAGSVGSGSLSSGSSGGGSGGL